MTLVVVAWVLKYVTIKQPPSMRMGHRRAHLWALFQCCNPKTKAKMRKNLASAPKSWKQSGLS